MPISLTTIEQYEIRSQGTVHVVEVPYGVDPRTLRGKTVVLDGTPKTVKGVELFGKMPDYDPDDPIWKRAGLLVDKDD